jgi:hypothetical protein
MYQFFRQASARASLQGRPDLTGALQQFQHFSPQFFSRPISNGAAPSNGVGKTDPFNPERQTDERVFSDLTSKKKQSNRVVAKIVRSSQQQHIKM